MHVSSVSNRANPTKPSEKKPKGGDGLPSLPRRSSFFEAGTKIQFGALTLSSVGLGLLLFLACMSGKWLGTYLPLRILSVPHARFAAIVFNYRLSFGLIAAIYGLETGLISEELSTVILLCVLASSLTAAYFQRKSSPETAEGSLGTQ